MARNASTAAPAAVPTGPVSQSVTGPCSTRTARIISSHATSASDGWVAMVQHYFTSAWLVPAGAPREFRTAKVSNNLYSVAMVLPLGEVAPGSTKTHDATLFAGPQEENKLAAMAPGLDLVKDYGWFTVLAKPLFWLLDNLNTVLGNWNAGTPPSAGCGVVSANPAPRYSAMAAARRSGAKTSLMIASESPSRKANASPGA